MDGGSLVCVVLVAIPLCQVQSCDANQRHKSVSYAMISKSTPVMRTPANPPKQESLRPTVDECDRDFAPTLLPRMPTTKKFDQLIRCAARSLSSRIDDKRNNSHCSKEPKDDAEDNCSPILLTSRDSRSMSDMAILRQLIC
jgi:hypothetical protein